MGIWKTQFFPFLHWIYSESGDSNYCWLDEIPTHNPSCYSNVCAILKVIYIYVQITWLIKNVGLKNLVQIKMREKSWAR